MANIGIVGSSFSQGRDGKIVDEEWVPLTKYLDEYLTDEMPHHNFYNVAKSGRGTERYLNNIVHLKKEYDITHLLIEVIQHRTVNYFWYNEEQYANDLNNWDRSALLKYSIEDDVDIVSFINSEDDSYISKSVFSDFSMKDIATWRDLNSYALYKSKHLQILAARDIETSISMCEMIGIIPIRWSFDLTLPYDCLKTDVEYELVEYMKKCGISYKDNTCDGRHLNDYAHRWAAKNYFKPIFERFV